MKSSPASQFIFLSDTVSVWLVGSLSVGQFFDYFYSKDYHRCRKSMLHLNLYAKFKILTAFLNIAHSFDQPEIRVAHGVHYHRSSTLGMARPPFQLNLWQIPRRDRSARRRRCIRRLFLPSLSSAAAATLSPLRPSSLSQRRRAPSNGRAGERECVPCAKATSPRSLSAAGCSKNGSPSIRAIFGSVGDATDYAFQFPQTLVNSSP